MDKVKDVNDGVCVDTFSTGEYGELSDILRTYKYRDAIISIEYDSMSRNLRIYRYEVPVREREITLVQRFTFVERIGILIFGKIITKYKIGVNFINKHITVKEL